MNIWFTSDTHYFHKNIIKYCERPYADLDAMHTDLRHRWNTHVQPDDVVVHLGDVTFMCAALEQEISDYIATLSGHKVLVLGNHDDASRQKRVLSRLSWTIVPDMRAGNIIYTHAPVDVKCHNAVFNVHGHVHNTVGYDFPQHWNAGVDVNNYNPVPASTVIPTSDLEALIERVTLLG